MKKLRITVEGKAYDVLVEMLDEASSAASAPAPIAPGSAATSVAAAAPAVTASSLPIPTARASAGVGDIASPLAGKVVSIDVAIGQTVNEGAQVATLEAMKMNTFIYASVGGNVTAVLVTAGDSVEEGTVLVKLA